MDLHRQLLPEQLPLEDVEDAQISYHRQSAAEAREGHAHTLPVTEGGARRRAGAAAAPGVERADAEEEEVLTSSSNETQKT